MSPDYTALLDAEIKAFIAICDAAHAPEATDQSITAQRCAYDALCTRFDFEHPEGVTTRDVTYANMPCRDYMPAGAPRGTVVYAHGGGFVVGGLDSHDSICADICGQTGLRVVAVDYPLAPEHRYPQDITALRDVYGAVADTCAGPLLLAGDSAGGRLMSSLSHILRDAEAAEQPAGQVLIYPSLGHDWTRPSHRTHAHAPLLSLDDVKFYEQIRLAGDMPVGEAAYAALDDTDFTGLPPTVCMTADCDPITSDSTQYCARITEAGGRALWINEAGLVHGYLRARRMSRRAGQSFDRICTALAGLADGVWPPVSA